MAINQAVQFHVAKDSELLKKTVKESTLTQDTAKKPLELSSLSSKGRSKSCPLTSRSTVRDKLENAMTVKQKRSLGKAKKVEEEKTTLESKAAYVVAHLSRCANDMERIQLLESNGLTLTKKQTVNRRSKLGKLVQDLLDAEKEEDSEGETTNSDRDTAQVSTPKLQREDLPELQNIPTDKAVDAEVIQMAEAYTDSLYTFYEELLANPKSMEKKM